MTNISLTICVRSKLLLEIKRKQVVSGAKCRVVWAPNLLLPIDAHETMIGLSVGNHAETYNIQEILQKNGAGTFLKEDLRDGIIMISDCHDKVRCFSIYN